MSQPSTPITRRDAPRGLRARIRAGASRSRSEDGQAVVEFALVLPIVVVILFGVVLFGVALNDWIDETQLTSEAARFAAVDNEHGLGGEINEEAFLKWITEQGDNNEVRKAKASMCSPTSAIGDYVEVKMTSQYKWFGLANLLGVEAETPLTSTARMRIERAPSVAYAKC